MKDNAIFLRRFTLADVDKLFVMSQEKELGQFLPDQVYKDLTEAREVVGYLIGAYSPNIDPVKAPYVLGVVHQASQELIGHVGLSAIERGVEIGYAIEKAQAGKGYATLAIALMLTQAKAKTALKTVYGVVDKTNTASIRVLEKCRFTPIETTEAKSIYARKL